MLSSAWPHAPRTLVGHAGAFIHRYFRAELNWVRIKIVVDVQLWDYAEVFVRT